MNLLLWLPGLLLRLLHPGLRGHSLLQHRVQLPVPQRYGVDLLTPLAFPFRSSKDHLLAQDFLRQGKPHLSPPPSPDQREGHHSQGGETQRSHAYPRPGHGNPPNRGGH